MKEEVVVTGMGCISSLGLGKDIYWTNLLGGVSGVRSLRGCYPDVGITIGAEVGDFNIDEHFSESQVALLDRFSQFAIVAAKEAISDADLAGQDHVLDAAAAIVGTGCGGKQTDEETYSQLYKEGKKRLHPLTIPKGMPSAAASTTSQILGIKGPVYSITSACASSAHAIIHGFMLIKFGVVDVALVGGTDAPFTYGLMKSWDALRVVASENCRPFSKDRDGMVLGEGAGMVVLESKRHAQQRQASIYARMIGFGMSSDAGHVTRPDIDGIAKAIGGALEYSNLLPENIDYINAHGTGTLANDLAETAAIKKVFGSHADRLMVSSTKSMHGHALGASSALEFIATVMAIVEGKIPPTINYASPDEECDLDYVPNVAREKNISRALSNSFAFGGLNAVIALAAE